MERDDPNQENDSLEDANQGQADSQEKERIIRETREAGLRAQGGGSPDDSEATETGNEGSGI